MECNPTKNKIWKETDWFNWDVTSSNSDAQCFDWKIKSGTGNKKLINTNVCEMCPYNTVNKKYSYNNWKLKIKIHKLLNPKYEQYK